MHTKECKGKENPAFNKDSHNSNLIQHSAGAIISNNSIGKVGIKTHSGSKANRPT
jgi:hypothetical protein